MSSDTKGQITVLACVCVRPILLLMDGHSSHYSPMVIQEAAKKKIILFTLPPHTTHLFQPLDKGCFGPFKSYWKWVCHLFYAGRVITCDDCLRKHGSWQ